MIAITDPKTFHLDFDLSKNIDENLKHEIEFIKNQCQIIKNNESLVENKLVFKIKDGYKLKLQMSETMKLCGKAEQLIDKTKNGEVVLIQCNLVESQHQKKSEVFIC